jgi:hypothetical protein
MGEKIDSESARRSAAAMSRLLGLLEKDRPKSTGNVVTLELKRKLDAPKPRPTLRAAE